ncbi:hypothetical protein [Nannocystis pusilla]|uniref:Invertebrate defensins family profile domain-containing protein n=1 Tax=Nannocystis pusilla TaxID=889268 RepID=A0ABS7TKH8_9BACT|nr:hypothetical protein [Nannocystis pusilla]MBZ5708730.1 hypothetical protein [Nannocystis pusilla]
MQLKYIIALFALVACDIDMDTFASSNAGDDESAAQAVNDGNVDDSAEFSPADDDTVDELEADARSARSFGCPFNSNTCHNHCKSIDGYKGGYCKGLLQQTCKCY